VLATSAKHALPMLSAEQETEEILISAALILIHSGVPLHAEPCRCQVSINIRTL
jgi:hypothetical protein